MGAIDASGAGSTQFIVLIVVLVFACGYFGLRARRQRNSQSVQDRVQVAKFAELRDISDFSEVPWGEHLFMGNDGAWQDLKLGSYDGRAILSGLCRFDNDTPTARHIVLVKMSDSVRSAPRLAIESRERERAFLRAFINNSEVGSEGNVAEVKRPNLEVVPYGDEALNKSWAVHSDSQDFARDVVDIAMRGRLFGIDAKKMELVAAQGVLSASFPAPASDELIRDRTILLTEFAMRIELYGVEPSSAES